MPDIFLYLLIVAPAIFLLAQSIFSLYQTLYIWNDPKKLAEVGVPEHLEKPHYGFTVLLPARHEQDVIGETLKRLSKANYPKNRLEFMVICTADDTETIAAARKAKKDYKIRNAKIVIFKEPAGKSRGMNIGLEKAKFPLLTIFDSEDDVSPDIFTIANTLYLTKRLDILQCGVQLMDYNSRWFSAHNVLEYFFWFKSRMHYYANLNSVPLGGNTVFFRQRDLVEVGGWDEHGLTEDADIGIRLSLKGRHFGAMYDPTHVTREECPHTMNAFVKQRTRWNQGFLQIIKKNDWRKLPKLKQALLVSYVLTAPSLMAVVIGFAPILIFLGASNKLPVLVSLFTYMPLMLMSVMMLVSLVGLHEFGRDQDLKIKPRSYVLLVLTFIPYQILLTISALRAVIRELRGNRGWEKTAHLGLHRAQAETVAGDMS